MDEMKLGQQASYYEKQILEVLNNVAPEPMDGKTIGMTLIPRTGLIETYMNDLTAYKLVVGGAFQIEMNGFKDDSFSVYKITDAGREFLTGQAGEVTLGRLAAEREYQALEVLQEASGGPLLGPEIGARMDPPQDLIAVMLEDLQFYRLIEQAEITIGTSLYTLTPKGKKLLAKGG